jgi:hypothetical protein
MIEFLLAMTLLFPWVSSFVVPVRRHVDTRRRYGYPIQLQLPGANTILAMDNTRPNKGKPGTRMQHTWSPQDLTKDTPGCLPIPDDDYVKKYQTNPELWPVEFFLIVYRRAQNKKTLQKETQILVRRSANGTSQWGLGTGVPATRWMLSTQTPPPGYKWSEQPISFEASNFPEFPKNGPKSWTYQKIDIHEDAFHGPDAVEFEDSELEEYARTIRSSLRTKLSQTRNDRENENSWESSRVSVVQNVLDNANSLSAIQGTLRMSGLFARRSKTLADPQQQNGMAGVDDSSPFGPRYVSLGKSDAPDSTKLVQSMRIFTMFPQMPDPMPLPGTPPEALQEEITSRESHMAQTGRDPHQDKYGRKFTHTSTSNVSNTIHGVYLTLDATDLPGLEEVPALDLFGTQNIKREWKSLEELQVLAPNGTSISTQDSKPTFISGLIVRQLVKEGIIDIHGS